MNPYFDEEGLLKANLNQESSENGMLYTCQYYFLRKPDYVAYANYYKCVDKCKVPHYSGLYNQYPNQIKLTGDDIYMSHDQLTSIISFLYDANNMKEVKAIWKEIKMQKFRYNNVTPDAPGLKFLHPRDILYCGYLAGSFICKLLFPILFLIILETTITKYKYRPTLFNRIKFWWETSVWMPTTAILKTDGLLLNFVRFNAVQTSGMKFTKKICEWILKKRFGEKYWTNIFNIYFPYDHPNVIEASKL